MGLRHLVYVSKFKKLTKQDKVVNGDFTFLSTEDDSNIKEETATDTEGVEEAEPSSFEIVLREHGGFRFTTLESVIKFSSLKVKRRDLSVEGDVYVEFDAVSTSSEETSGAIARKITLTSERQQIFWHILKNKQIYHKGVRFVPIVCNELFCNIISAWEINKKQRLDRFTKSAFHQIRNSFDIEETKELGAHELWELCLDRSNHKFISDELLECAVDILDNAPRATKLQYYISGALSALVFSSSDFKNRLGSHNIVGQVLRCIRTKVGGLTDPNPPQCAFFMFGILSCYLNDCFGKHNTQKIVNELSFFFECLHFAQDEKLRANVCDILCRVFTYKNWKDSIKCCQLHASKKSKIKDGTKNSQMVFFGPFCFGASSTISFQNVSEWIYELGAYAASDKCRITNKLQISLAIKELAQACSEQAMSCKSKGRGNVNAKKNKNSKQGLYESYTSEEFEEAFIPEGISATEFGIPLLNPLREVLLCSKVVPASIVGLSCWCITVLALEYYKDSAISSWLTWNAEDDEQYSAQGVIDRTGGSTKKQLCKQMKGYLHEYAINFDRTTILLNEVNLHRKKDGFPISRQIDELISEVLCHLAYIMYVWCEAIEVQARCRNRQSDDFCSRWVYSRNRRNRPDATHRCGTYVPDKDIVNVVNVLFLITGIAQENWITGQLCESSGSVSTRSQYIEMLATASIERLSRIPDCAQLLVSRFSESSPSEQNKSENVDSDAKNLHFPKRVSSNSECISKNDILRTMSHSARIMNRRTNVVNRDAELFMIQKQQRNIISEEIHEWVSNPLLVATYRFFHSKTSHSEVSQVVTLLNLLQSGVIGHNYVKERIGLFRLLKPFQYRARYSPKFLNMLAAVIMLFSYGPLPTPDIPSMEKNSSMNKQLDNKDGEDANSQNDHCSDSGSVKKNEGTENTMGYSPEAYIHQFIRNKSKTNEYIEHGFCPELGKHTMVRMLNIFSDFTLSNIEKTPPAFNFRDNREYIQTMAYLCMTVWCVARNDYNRSFLLENGVLILLHNLLESLLVEVKRMFPEGKLRKHEDSKRSKFTERTILESLHSCLSALWMVTSRIPKSSIVLGQAREICLIIKVSKLITYLWKVLHASALVKNRSNLESRVSKHIIQIFVHGLNLLFNLISMDIDFVESSFVLQPDYGIAKVLKRVAVDELIHARIRDRATTILLYLSKCSKVIRSALSRQLGCDLLLNIGIQLINDQNESLRNSGAQVLAKIPLNKQQHNKIRDEGMINTLIDLVTSGRQQQQTSALQALLNFSSSSKNQLEILHTGLYRLMIFSWKMVNRDIENHRLATLILQKISEHPESRTYMYRAELRVKEMAGWHKILLKDSKENLPNKEDVFRVLRQASRMLQNYKGVNFIDKHTSHAAVASNLKKVEFLEWFGKLLNEDTNNIQNAGLYDRDAAVSVVLDSLHTASKAKSNVSQISATTSKPKRSIQSSYSKNSRVSSAYSLNCFAEEPSENSWLFFSPDKSPLWPYRSIIPNPLSKKEQTDDNYNKNIVSRNSNTAVEAVEEISMESKIAQARKKAHAKTNKTCGSPKPPTSKKRNNSGNSFKRNLNFIDPNISSRMQDNIYEGDEKTHFSDRLAVKLDPDCLTQRVEDVDENTQEYSYSEKAFPGLKSENWKLEKNSRRSNLSVGDMMEANKELNQRLRYSVSSMWERTSKRNDDDRRWSPEIIKMSKEKKKKLKITSGKSLQTFSFVRNNKQGIQEPKDYIKLHFRKISKRSNSAKQQIQEKKNQMAMFNHVEGSKVLQNTPIYTLPSGERAHLYHAGQNNEAGKYLAKNENTPPPPTTLRLLDRFEVDIDEEFEQNKPLRKDSVNNNYSKSQGYWSDKSLQILNAMPLIPTHHDFNSIEIMKLVKASGYIGISISRPEMPDCYTQQKSLTNGKFAARRFNGNIKSSQIGTGVQWSKFGKVIDPPIKFLVSTPAKIKALLEKEEGASETVKQLATVLSANSQNTHGAQDFDLENSVFYERKQVAESRDYWDDGPFLEKCFLFDWEICLDKTAFQKFLKKGKYSKEDIEETKQLLIYAAPLIYGSFSFYSSLNEGNPFAMHTNSFFQFLNDANILDKDSSGLNNAKAENIFAQINASIPESLSKDMQTLNKECAAFKVRKDRVFMRYEFVESIVKLACVKYSSDLNVGETNTMSYCVEKLLEETVGARLGGETLLNADEWRTSRLYVPQVAKLLAENKDFLHNWFKSISSTGDKVEAKKWGGKSGERLTVKEWHQELKQLGLYNESFTRRESSIAFTQSIMKVSNNVKYWQNSMSLTFIEFVEAIGRTSDMIVVPTEAQLKFIGVDDTVEFYLFMECTNLWAAVEELGFSSNDRSRLMIWEPKGNKENPFNNSDPRPLSFKLGEFLKVARAKQKFNDRRKIEKKFWSKAKTRQERKKTKRSSRLTNRMETENTSANEAAFEALTAAKLHNAWRKQRKIMSDGTFEPRLKEFDGKLYDIANLEYSKLPLYYQLENLISAHSACEYIRAHFTKIYKKTSEDKGATVENFLEDILKIFMEEIMQPEFLEEAAAQQHDQWRMRNNMEEENTDAQLEYDELSEESKEKNRDIVRIAVKAWSDYTF